jgi:hypothetical protein
MLPLHVMFRRDFEAAALQPRANVVAQLSSKTTARHISLMSGRAKD